MLTFSNFTSVASLIAKGAIKVLIRQIFFHFNPFCREMCKKTRPPALPTNIETDVDIKLGFSFSGVNTDRPYKINNSK